MFVAAFVAASISAIGHGGEDPIVVVEVADPLDQRSIDYVVAALQADGSLVR
jgi:hypothetical protein